MIVFGVIRKHALRKFEFSTAVPQQLHNGLRAKRKVVRPIPVKSSQIQVIILDSTRFRSIPVNNTRFQAIPLHHPYDSVKFHIPSHSTPVKIPSIPLNGTQATLKRLETYLAMMPDLVVLEVVLNDGANIGKLFPQIYVWQVAENKSAVVPWIDY